MQQPHPPPPDTGTPIPQQLIRWPSDDVVVYTSSRNWYILNDDQHIGSAGAGIVGFIMLRVFEELTYPAPAVDLGKYRRLKCLPCYKVCLDAHDSSAANAKASAATVLSR
jgi:hypothetical protein